MRALPEEFDAGELIGFLADGWGFEVEGLEYAAVGGGSYHWIVRDAEGKRGFVTVDHLDRKPWFGDTRESVFEGLTGAFDTALALRDGGLDFVVAPMPTTRGETVRRIDSRYTVALFPFVDGQAGQFGAYDTAERARSWRCSPSSIEQRPHSVRAGSISSYRAGASSNRRFER